MKLKLLLMSITFTSYYSFAQVGIGIEQPHESSLFELNSNNKGFLPPRVNLLSSTDVSTIKSPVTGLIVYNIGISDFPAGYYYFSGTQWVEFVKFDTPIGEDTQKGAHIVKQRLETANPNIELTTYSGLYSFRYSSTKDGGYWQIKYNGTGNRIISTFVIERWSPSGFTNSSGNATLSSNSWVNIVGGSLVGQVNELNIFRIYDNTDGRIIRFEGILINSNGIKESMIVKEF